MNRNKKTNLSKKWDKLYSVGVNYKPLNLLFLKNLLNRIKKISGKKPKTVLDLGCGTGDSLIKLKESGIKKIKGFDFSEVAIKIAIKNISNCDLEIKDLENFDDEDDERFDFILCKFTIAFIKDKEKFLKSVKKIMGEKSIFCIITPILHKEIKYTKNDKPWIAVDYRELKKILKKNFKTVEEYHHDYQNEKMDIATFLVAK